MKLIRIFISSPRDVNEERERARQVIEGLQWRYAGRLKLKVVAWERMPLEPHQSFQEQIRDRLAQEPVDIAVFILWSRLGSLQDEAFRKPDGSLYRSGTEHELDLMLDAKAASADGRPNILVYRREDQEAEKERRRQMQEDELEESIEQKKLLHSFIVERFEDAHTKRIFRAIHSFQKPLTFGVVLRDHLQAILDPLSGHEYAEPVWSIADHGSPFQGLDHYKFEHAAIFSGREDQTLEVRLALREQAKNGCAFVLIHGASGSGKSSLARAGVIPGIVDNEVDDMIQGWRHLDFIPSLLGLDDLFGGFARVLVQALPEITTLGISSETLARHLSAEPAAALDLCIKPALTRAAGDKPGEVRLVLLADQLEELFGGDEKVTRAREPFLLMLEALACSGIVWVIATLRSDFFASAQTSDALLRMRRGKGSIEITFPGDDAIRRMVEEPALRAGLQWEKQGEVPLASRIVQDARGRGELLPLLAYLLGQLFELDRRRWEAHEADGAPRAARRLTFASYCELGGVEGALQKVADEKFAELREKVQDQAQEQFSSVMRRLTVVSQDDAGRFTRRWAGYDELHASAGAFIDAFLKARLFVAKSDDAGLRVVSVAHEAILAAWPRLREWLEENKKAIKANTAIIGDARLWRTNNHDKGFLYQPGLQLDEANHLLEQGFLEQPEAEFVEKSIEAAAANAFAARLETGKGFIECWHEMAERHPEARIEVVREALGSATAARRKNAALLLGIIAPLELTRRLEDLVVRDADDTVRRAAALSLMRLDRVEAYEAVRARLAQENDSGDGLGAMARMLISADMETPAPRFDDWFRALPDALRRKVRVHSWKLRARSAVPVYFAVVIPAVIICVAVSMCYKWMPGMFNWAYGQAVPSGAMSFFHAVTAAILIGGFSAFGLCAWRMIFGREHDEPGYSRSFGAIVFGAVFGAFGGLLCTAAIAGVFIPSALATMGWLEADAIGKGSSLDFLTEIFVKNRCGWVFVLNGMGVGIGMALLTNRLHGASAWEDFLDAQSASALTDFSRLWTVLKGLVRIASPYGWTLPASLAATSLLGLLLLYGAKMDAQTDPGWMKPLPDSSWNSSLFGGCVPPPRFAKDHKPTKEEKELQDKQTEAWRKVIRDWKTSLQGRVLGITCDSIAKALGGFFAAIGMGFGVVLLRAGVTIEASRRTSVPLPAAAAAKAPPALP